MKIGISGFGFVGKAINYSLELHNFKPFIYDKFIEKYNDCNVLLQCDFIFLALPTIYDNKLKSYNLQPIEENLEFFKNNNYKGIIIIKSTIEPKTTTYLYKKYNLKIIHNPEFLTARTACEDFHNMKNIILGLPDKNIDIDIIIKFFITYYPDASISITCSDESEAMKSFINCFYSVKVQFFTELYCLCEKIDIDYNNVKNLMIGNNWINPMHTDVPGPDGNISYGGLCFPKDTNALYQFMEKHKSPNSILKACIDERNTMRDDHINCNNENNDLNNDLNIDLNL